MATTYNQPNGFIFFVSLSCKPTCIQDMGICPYIHVQNRHKTMTLYQYKLLDNTDQACVLANKGVYLVERRDQEYKIALYQIDGFYVEAFYRPDDNAIMKLRSFQGTKQLQPYLHKIEIGNLL